VSELSCIFCGKTFEPNEILFINNSGKQWPDRVKKDFLKDYDALSSQEEFEGTYYRINFGDTDYNSSGIPIKMRNPKLLSGVKPDDLTAENPEDIGVGEGPAELVERVCPHCHCKLPHDFGTLVVHRAVLVGGRGAGKTTYIINALQQLGMQLTEKNLGTYEMLPESNIYYKSLLDNYKETQGISLGTEIKKLFPLIFYYNNGIKGCFVAIYDIAGEAYNGKHDTFLQNHTGVKSADTLLFIIDPHQLYKGIFEEPPVAEDANGNPTYRRKCEFNADDPFDPFGRNELKSFITSSIKSLSFSLENYRDILFILAKVDLPLQADLEELIPSESTLNRDLGQDHTNGIYPDVIEKVDKDIVAYIIKKYETLGIAPINVREKILEEFMKNTVWLDYVNRKVDENRAKVTRKWYQKKKSDDELRAEDRKYAQSLLPHVTCFGVSTLTKNGDRFENQYKEDAKKHRIIEPIIYMLCKWGMIPVLAPERTSGSQRRR
jgi:hypothetical protein